MLNNLKFAAKYDYIKKTEFTVILQEGNINMRLKPIIKAILLENGKIINVKCVRERTPSRGFPFQCYLYITYNAAFIEKQLKIEIRESDYLPTIPSLEEYNEMIPVYIATIKKKTDVDRKNMPRREIAEYINKITKS